MIVMKFGGTSVQDAAAISQVAEIVASRLNRAPVIVVSAMARVTDALLRIAHTAMERRFDTTTWLINDLRDRHLATARELMSQYALPGLGDYSLDLLERKVLDQLDELE